MSKFDTFYDALRAKVITLTGFTSKVELPNPYILAANPQGMLKDGWGITIGSSSVGPSEFGSTTDLHVINIVLTRELLTTENNAAPTIAAVKALKSDAQTLMTYLERGDSFATSATLERFSYSSTSPITFSEGQTYRYLSMTLTFLAGIREDLH